MQTKKCSRCRTDKPLDSFYVSKIHRGGRHSYCIPCHKAEGAARVRRNPEPHRAAVRRWQRRNPDKVRAQRLAIEYGIVPEEYDALLRRQAGVCAICGAACPKYSNLSVDHCHKTGRVRGLLCDPCNNGLGRFGDDPDRLVAAADYLRQHLQRQGKALEWLARDRG